MTTTKSTTQVETHALRSGDVVVVIPGLEHRRFHPAKAVDNPGAVEKTVAYVTRREGVNRASQRATFLDVVFTDRMWAGGHRTAGWLVVTPS
jgi:hypothetical protein